MKKESIYQVMMNKSQIWVCETKGYLYRIIGVDYSVDVGLVYKRPYWFATHYPSGMECTPCSDKGGMEKKWKNKDALLEALKTIPFKSLEALEVTKMCTQKVNEYKEKISCLSQKT